ncbi:ABC transporter ATP-binding protein [Cellulomonas sp. ICMP 17802]|uniref:ABC transporter ATP-binding protein n=1 Tax=Cellulomonas sp. ICMP 17802 TaxID=3239199 RepID=UPI00351B9C54
MIAVVCTEVARTFGTGRTAVVAVHAASLTVRAGQRVALLGPSGSGKSTLLHLMAGIERPTAGTVSWPGLTMHPDGGRPAAGRLGLVLQGPSLLPPLDVRENVALPLVLAGVDEREAALRADAAMELVGVSDLAAQLPEELSGGQSQRVAIARVVAMRPSLVLADEPTGQLDHPTATHVLDVLDAAAAEIGAAVVLTTHDPAVAARFDARWTMRDGRLAVHDGVLA